MKVKYIFKTFILCLFLVYCTNIFFSLDLKDELSEKNFIIIASSANANSSQNMRQDDAGNILMRALAQKMEGKAILESGTDTIQGLMCKTFKYGENRTERFVAHKHFAVCPNGEIYQMDIISADWITYNNDN